MSDSPTPTDPDRQHDDEQIEEGTAVAPNAPTSPSQAASGEKKTGESYEERDEAEGGRA